ncbi:MAG: hypothetical protein WAW96_12360 [Alphaproteobacteria bacterium]
MRNLLGLSCAFALAGAAAFADTTPAPSPPSKWALASDQTYTILLANLADSNLTYVYRICQGDGPGTHVDRSFVAGQFVTLAAGACVDVATQGSVRLMRADATDTKASSGTYQFIYAVASHSAPARSS